MQDLTIISSVPTTKNIIRFNYVGALDFTEHVDIHISDKEHPGYTLIHPMEFLKVVYLPYVNGLILQKLSIVLNRRPHISDLNEDIPEENRLTKMWYKCEYMYHHSHDIFKKPIVKQYELKTAINKIKHKKLCLS